MSRIKNISTSAEPFQEPAHPLSAGMLHFEKGQPRDFVLRLHQHQNLELNYVLKGSLTYFHCGRVHRLEQDQLGIFWASHPHLITEVANETSMIWFHVPLSISLQWKLCSDFLERILEGHILVDAKSNISVDAAKARQWLEDCQSHDTFIHEIVCQEMECCLKRMSRSPRTTWTDSLEADAFPQSAQPHPKAIQMATHIADHFRQPITLQQIAETVRLNPSYASSIFRRSFNIPLNEFINKCRIGYSIGLLANTKRTIVDIAFASGFGSVSRFYEVFAKQTAKQPSDYR